MGAAVVGFKLGDRGFYAKASSEHLRLEAVPIFTSASAASWSGAELYTPCRRAEVVGTTGAGDCTIAGFLAGVLHGLTPEAAIGAAVAVGGASVEAREAVAGVPSWDELRERMAAGWPFHPAGDMEPDWAALPGGGFCKSLL